MNRALVVLVVVGALLDVFVFGAQVAQYGRIDRNAATANCWSAVLYQAVQPHKPTKAFRARLLAEARQCPRPSSPPPFAPSRKATR